MLPNEWIRRVTMNIFRWVFRSRYWIRNPKGIQVKDHIPFARCSPFIFSQLNACLPLAPHTPRHTRFFCQFSSFFFFYFKTIFTWQLSFKFIIWPLSYTYWAFYYVQIVYAYLCAEWIVPPFTVKAKPKMCVCVCACCPCCCYISPAV